MDLRLDPALAEGYASGAQRARVLTEAWFARHAYCPACGSGGVGRHGNNRPAADFFCARCGHDFELKSGKRRIGDRVPDGAYDSMVARLDAPDAPHLCLMAYDARALAVRDLLVVPRHVVTPRAVERRKPLAPTARRAGWVGCNLVLRDLPEAGRVFLVRDGIAEPKERVLATWRKTAFLDGAGSGARGWLLDVWRCVEDLGRAEFSIADAYGFEARLSRLYPGNRNVRPKIRQQLQVLRDNGRLVFLGGGTYRVVG